MLDQTYDPYLTEYMGCQQPFGCHGFPLPLRSAPISYNPHACCCRVSEIPLITD